ncbi:MAG: DNA/RNA nuclease SfsA, partial [Nitrospirae bacterium]|nr:DNA/RNA nuclease SfsA [Nitrospirota bacterium]
MHLIKGNLEKAIFRDRPNRFTVECFLRGKTVKAYLPNPGRLWELLLPGSEIYLLKNPSRDKLSYTVIATERDGIPILLHTHLTNSLVEGLMKEKRIPGFEDIDLIRREVSFGKSRYDFLLSRGRKQLVLEVKTCTLFGDTLAMFPDAVTERGSRHIIELSRLREKGVEGGVLFVVQWPYARYFMPEYHTDFDFSRNLLNVRDSLLIKAIAVGLKRDLSVNSVKELVIPWELIE